MPIHPSIHPVSTHPVSTQPVSTHRVSPTRSMHPHLRRHATRAAVVATTSAAVTLLAVLPATAAAPTVAPASVPATATATATAPSVAPAVHTAALFAALPAPALPLTDARIAQVALAAPAAPAASARASAVQLALSKVGSPYRWGATGPSSFDCSGLVNWAFEQAGIEVPRTSRALSRVGTPVARGDLQPGDLVFFYSPVSHVGIYIGDGQMVHASTSGKPVAIAPIEGRRYNSARRL